jgi:hypothetical protein
VDALQLHSNTQSHWSSGSTIASCPEGGGGAAVRIPGMHPHLQWNWALLLAMSRYIADPNVILDHRLQLVLFARDLATILANICLSHVLPSSIPLLAGPFPPCNTVKSSGQIAGGSPVEALHLHSNTQSHWSSGSTVCFPPRGQRSRSRDASTLTMEPGSPVGDISQDW